MHTLIVFDVSSNKARARLVKVLRAHARRVQKSVFEAADLPDATFLRMRGKIEALVDPETDSVRYYRLCQACCGRVDHYGRGPGRVIAHEGFVLVGSTGVPGAGTRHGL